MERNINLQQQKANRESDSKAIRSGNMGLKGAPAINGEGLSNNAVKKAAREAKKALRRTGCWQGRWKGQGQSPEAWWRRLYWRWPTPDLLVSQSWRLCEVCGRLHPRTQEGFEG
eukprot:16433430-Heterocapsa_arctica.AAC.1